MTGLPGWARRRPAIRDAVAGRLAEIVLGDALDELLGEFGGDRARERLTRGWDVAVGQPRYGPATVAVIELLGRLAALSPSEVVALNVTGTRRAPRRTAVATRGVARGGRGPPGLLGAGRRRRRPRRAVRRWSQARAAGCPASRVARSRTCWSCGAIFPTAAFDRIAAPWLGDLVPRAAPWRSATRRAR